MTMLRERLQPIAPAAFENPWRGNRQEPLWLRYAGLVKLGFSRETSLIVAEAPVPLHAVTGLLAPDAR